MSRLANFTPKSHSEVKIVYLGSLEKTKLHPDFIDIVAGINTKGIHFDMFGDADTKTIVSLTQALNEKNILERVSFHGHVEQITDAFAEADIFAYPLALGGYATSEKSLQEAMWAGLPCVVMAGTAATGWIKHGVTGFITNNCDEFILTLKQLADDHVLRRRIGDAAATEARKFFDPNQNSLRIMSIYMELLERPKRKRSPISGIDSPPHQRFLQSLGEFEKMFLSLINIDRQKKTPNANLNVEILLSGEGGLIHYIKTFPEDKILVEWMKSFQSYMDS
jgi:hypothetical protein